MTRGVPGGQFESPAPNRRVLMRIDHNGEVLIGCIDCNRWGRPGGRDETLGSARTVMTILGALRHEGVEVARGQPMRTPGTQGSRDALNWCKVINGPLGGRNASQAHRARSDSDSPVDHDDDYRTPARHDPPLRRRWRLCQQLCTIYASLSKELLAPWGGALMLDASDGAGMLSMPWTPSTGLSVPTAV